MSNPIDDSLKEWEERYTKAQELFKGFKELYEDRLGVVSIRDDDWFGDTFIVMYDNKKFDMGTIPNDYKGILIQFYDVYQARDSFQSLHDHLKDQYPQADESLFMKNLNHLNEVIQEYEKREAKRKAYLDGYSAGLWEENAKNPYEKGTEEHESWAKGNSNGFADWDLGMDDGG